MSITIPALSKIQCNVTPTEDSDLANKKYVDDAVAAAGGGGADPDRLAGGSAGVYALAPDRLDQSTYLVPQTAVAAEYSASATYQIGDLCVFRGDLWQRRISAGSGIEPSTSGVLWAKVNVASLLTGSGGSADKKTATVDSGTSRVDMSGNPEVIIVGEDDSMFLGTIGLIFTNLVFSGMLSVEVHVTYDSAAPRYAFKVSTGSTVAVLVTWVRGSLADLSDAGTHIVRLRAFPNGSEVYAEYVGKY